MRIAIRLWLAAVMLGLLGCGNSEKFSDLDAIDFTAYDPAPELSRRDSTRAHLSRLFLVEQPTIRVNPTMLHGMKTQAPGGILFWNGNKVDALATREVIRAYSAKAKAAGQLPLLFSMDYEGGDLGLTPSGRHVPGIQRVHSGLSKLAHPIWLGRTLKQFGGEECALHGQIIATELDSIGMNYPLGTVTDIAKNLMAVRGISSNPEKIARCMEALLQSVADHGDMIFVTKHFPGLGHVPGDTHEGVAHSTDTTLAQMESSLRPYRRILAELKAKHIESRLSIMSTHAVYPAIDGERLSTESSAVLTDLLSTTLGFAGIRLSDAMWMGGYGELGDSALMPVYISAILAGEDMLMIPGTKFAVALEYVRRLYDGSLSQGQQQALESHLGQTYTQIRAAFTQRAHESLARQSTSLKDIHHSVDVMSAPDVRPTDLTADARSRYYDILLATDSRWSSVFPGPSLPTHRP